MNCVGILIACLLLHVCCVPVNRESIMLNVLNIFLVVQNIFDSAESALKINQSFHVLMNRFENLPDYEMSLLH